MGDVTFSVRTYGMGAFPADEKLIVAFEPSGPGFTALSSFPQRTVYAEPEADGFVRVNLAPTLGLSPEVYYRVRFEWFYRHPVEDRWIKRGWSDVATELRVPSQGGDLGELLASTPPPGAYIWGFGPPPKAINAIYVDLLGMVGGLYIPTGTVGI
ncbi:hypothetical protein LPW41_11650 [Microbacterium sp. JC 701]|uniref:hypothetical protein n=1 Tax=Microbacterium sp. JC 701 TaxID=2897389 RepID=UPI001E2A44A9|nr:hypothetical protein [Microbacterium sp. JC 701]MCD2170351.1 hypothetical protein [Microbacterium sp. JC 701]